MKRTLAKVTTLGAALLLIGCPTVTTNKDPAPQSTPTTQATQAAQTQTTQATQSPQLTAAQATANCMTCHGDSTELGEKVQNARDTWAASVHAKGFVVPLYDSTGAIIGHESEGADSFYANGGSCQVCHTKEGFNKKVEGKYADATAITSDYIQKPSTLTCFTCHRPHTKGNFDLVVPNGTSVTLTSGAVYSKPKGSICVSCHQSRASAAGAEADAISSAKGSSGIGFRFGPHYGLEADMHLGKAGAQYAGKTYGNGPHTALAGADCLTCHMTYPAARFGGSPNLSGHSFNVIGTVHGAEKANTAGCVACHTTNVTAKVVGASGALAAKGHLKKGDAYFAKGTTQLASEINDLLSILVDPDATGSGLIETGFRTALASADAKISWSADGRYLPTAFAALKDASASASSPKVRWAKALYNYRFVKDDKSMGVHNSTYAKQLLWDSIEDLISLTGAATPSTFPATRP